MSFPKNGWSKSGLSCSVVSTRDKPIVWSELKRRLSVIDVWCGLEQSIFDETIDQWRERFRACPISALKEDTSSIL